MSTTPFQRFVTRRPITAFAVLAFGIGWPLLALQAVTGLPLPPFLLGLTYVVLLGSALAVTRIAGGPGAVRTFLSRLLIWRFPVGRWATVVLAMPAATIAVAAATGTLQTPEGGWLLAAANYLFQTFIFGALLLNLAEETVWSGFVQTRLMQRRGLLAGSLLTVPFFVGIHLPLQFQSGWTWAGVGIGVGFLVLAAPFIRYLMGDHLLATGGSLLAVGLQHASFNASSAFGSGGWQYVAGVIVVAVAVGLVRRFRRDGSGAAADPITPAPAVA
jgi:membrane protease YdiL (CAAX protease family)